MISLDFLIKDAYLTERRTKDFNRIAASEDKENERWIKEHFFELSPEEQEKLKQLRPRRPRSPSQIQESPSPGGRRKKKPSS